MKRIRKLAMAAMALFIAMTMAVGPAFGHLWETTVFAADNALIAQAATNDVPAAPVASRKSGTTKISKTSMNITLSCKTEGAAIYYSVNGGKYKKYTSAIKITKNTTLRAYSKTSKGSSKKVTYTYKLVPKLTFKETDYSDMKLITMSVPSGTKLYYTTDGSKPTTSSSLAPDTGILLTESCTLKVLVVKSGWTRKIYYKTYTLEQSSPETPTVTEVPEASGDKYFLNSNFDTPEEGSANVNFNGENKTLNAKHISDSSIYTSSDRFTITTSSGYYKCFTCHGSGTCTFCNGTGTWLGIKCSSCEKNKGKCEFCNGTGLSNTADMSGYVAFTIWNKEEFETGDALNLSDLSKSLITSVEVGGWGIAGKNSIISSENPEYFDDVFIKAVKLDWSGAAPSEFEFRVTVNDGSGNRQSIEGKMMLTLTGSKHVSPSKNPAPTPTKPLEPTISTSPGNTGLNLCLTCGGTGKCQKCFGSKYCPVCLGKGGMSVPTYGTGGSGWVNCSGCHGSKKCSRCYGSGKCQTCGGSGRR